MTGRLLGAAVLMMVVAGPLAAQVAMNHYDLRRLDGAVFREQLHTDVTTQAGAVERLRTMVRTVSYSLVLRADTLVVTADSVDLDETADHVPQHIDVDAVTGGRWKLTLDARGTAQMIDAPFVPQNIADVSDVSRAMEDFFPPSPPSMGLNKQVVDGPDRSWRRLADSGGLQRYRLSTGTPAAVKHSMADSVPVESTQAATETAEIVWDVARGPVGWTRHISTNVVSRFAGRTVRALVDQRIVVRRTR